MTDVAQIRHDDETRAGSYFVSNYPPYAFWKPDYVPEALASLDRPPAVQSPLGLYIHIPFCRKRCHFCYFKVYTDKNASEVERYLDAVAAEAALYAPKAFVGGRKPTFVYFGGGTPSYISSTQLTGLADRIKRLFPWDEAREVAFECEPGTITEGKLEAIKAIGVTRLSLGVENFNEEILKKNGRAHGEKHIVPAYELARKVGFNQINIDLIAGMIDETEENWRDCVARAIALQPDAITVYQMEVPFNTTIFKEMKVYGETAAPVAPWGVKRRWIEYAFAELEKAGYTIGSAYTAVRTKENASFLYRDLLWRGADMLGLGVASFSHVQGTHFQNEHEFENYIGRANGGELPIFRALRPLDDERMMREMILQMKLGRVQKKYFEDKFGIDIHKRFAPPLHQLRDEGFLEIEPDGVRLNRQGLLRVDRLLHEFFKPEHRVA
ncbi:MAG: coproporphyrinogen-III oxidase family protein [Bryobacteraceae bacterium]